MLDDVKIIKPQDIEKKSFEIITGILGDRVFDPLHEPLIKRVIHTTADFEYTDILNIGENAIQSGIEAIKSGCGIVTDTKMAASGINKKVLEKWGSHVVCHMDDDDVADTARSREVTRASVCMEKAAEEMKNRIYVIGNAPTALIRLCELVEAGKVKPALVIGVPVGFVNVVESKEMLKRANVPAIITEGGKGGSTVAAAIVNAILYMI